MDLTIFHTTNRQNIISIKEGGFRIRHRDDHWLGNGIYFYLDRQLAEWWGNRENPYSGNRISNPAVITLNIRFDDEKVLDLRKLDQYNECLNVLDVFYEKVPAALSAEDNKHSKEKLRCSFFDWLFKTQGYDAIIGNFVYDGQEYLNSTKKKLFEMPFAESQICIREGYIENGVIAAKSKPLEFTI